MVYKVPLHSIFHFVNHHHITEGLFTVLPCIWYSMSGYQEKITRHIKGQKTQFEETEQASELYLAGKVELKDDRTHMRAGVIY